MNEWKFDISFVAESESHKQAVEKWLDDLFASTSMRRISTNELLRGMPKGKVIITYEDTGVRH